MSTPARFITAIAILLVTITGSLFIGSQQIPPGTIMMDLARTVTGIDSIPGMSRTDDKIIWKTRLPRIVLAALVGSSLALSGLVFQVLLRNPLAEPFTLGISSGGSFGVALALFLGVQIGRSLPILPFALVGGMFSTLIILVFSIQKRVSLFTIIFAGISISFFFNAILTLLMSLLGNRSYEVLVWMFGTFQRPFSLPAMLVPAVTLTLVTILVILFSTRLDAFYFSDDVTSSMGVSVNKTRTILFTSVSLLAVISVAYCGIIGFIGLMVPHLVRILFGNRHRILVPAALILGAILTVVSDTIARSLFSLVSGMGRELPVGVITALLGSPFFLYLLVQYRHRVLER
jgi:iron complex transport system permease protein